MAYSGIRLGSWEYLGFGLIKPIIDNSKVVDANIIAYPVYTKEYFTFITSEAHKELDKCMSYRKEAGEEIDEKRWVMHWKSDNKKGMNGV